MGDRSLFWTKRALNISGLIMPTILCKECFDANPLLRPDSVEWPTDRALYIDGEFFGTVIFCSLPGVFDA